eukprot:1111492-Pyramimonas_sp.AAC.1
MAVEVSAEWPKLAAEIAFLPKRLGGARPIAHIRILARVQARLRRPIAREWELPNDRSYS